MGDCGSMFIGFFMASSALVNVAGGRSRSLLPVLAVPILVLFIPIFDTTFVTILRKASGRAASQGGRDHTSHRLVALGMSERHAVWMLYDLQRSRESVPVGATDEAGCKSGSDAGFTVLLTCWESICWSESLGPSEESQALKDKSLYTFLVDVSYINDASSKCA